VKTKAIYKIIRPTTLLVVVLALTVPIFAEFYKVRVSRIEHNLYQDYRSEIYIKTRNCNENANREDAILNYEPSSNRNSLIFENDHICDVEKVFK